MKVIKKLNSIENRRYKKVTGAGGINTTMDVLNAQMRALEIADYESTLPPGIKHDAIRLWVNAKVDANGK